MTEIEIQAVTALGLVKTNCGFDRNVIKAFSEREQEKPLQKRTQWRLWVTVWTYRRQIERKDLVEFAAAHIGEDGA